MHFVESPEASFLQSLSNADYIAESGTFMNPIKLAESPPYFSVSLPVFCRGWMIPTILVFISWVDPPYQITTPLFDYSNL